VYVFLRWDIYWSLSCGWKEIRLNILYNSNQTASWNILCMLHKRQVVGMSWERSCTSFHSLCTYKLFYWFQQYSYMKVFTTWKTCNLESFGENVKLHSVLIARRHVKCGKAAVYIHNVSYFPYILRERERENCDLWLQDCCEWKPSFHCRLHLLLRIYSWRKQLEGKVPIIHDTKD
jgi:hypothetical protein